MTSPRALHAGGAADDHPAPVGWYCAGHAPRVLPVVLDGVALNAGFGVELVGAVLRGERPTTRPEWLGPPPAEWLVRAWHTLADRAVADELARVVAGFLDPARPEVASALAFFAGVPSGAGAAARTALEAHFKDLPEGFVNSKAPFLPHERLDRILRRTLRRLES